MAKDAYLSVRVPKELRDEAQEKSARGEISRRVRSVLRELSERDDAEEVDDSRPGNWSRIREKVLIRDDYTCRNCGAQGWDFGDAELHVHHIVPKYLGGNDRMTNLVTLCSGCHSKVHSIYKK